MAEPSQRPEETPAGGAAEPAADEFAAAQVAAANQARTARRQRAGGGSMLFYLVLMLIGAAAVVVTAPAWQPQVSALLGLEAPSTTPAAPSDDRVATLQSDVESLSQQVQASIDDETLQRAIEPLNAEIAALKQEIAALKSEIETLRNSAGSGSTTLSQGPGVDLTPIEERLGKLETALSDANTRLDQVASAQGAPSGTTAPASDSTAGTSPAPDPRVDSLVSENEALKQQIASLTERLDQMSGLDAKVGELAPRLDALAPRLDALDQQVAALPKSNEQQHAVAMIVAVGELRSALASDKSFAAELSTLNDLTQDDEALRPRLKPIVDKLAPMADAGVPTLSQLAAAFPATEIARAGEAELAGEVTDDNWLKRFWRGLGHSISEVITVRPTGPDVEGDDTLARLARAEAKLGEGDLAAAVAEVKALTGLAAETAAEWLAQAEARLAIEESAAQLADISTRELAPRTMAPAGVAPEGAGN